MWFPYLWAMWNANYISLAQTGLVQIFNMVCWRKQRILFMLLQRQMYFMTPYWYLFHVIRTKMPPPKSIGVIMYLISLIFNRKSFCSNKVLSSRKGAEKEQKAKLSQMRLFKRWCEHTKVTQRLGDNVGETEDNTMIWSTVQGWKHFFEFYWSGFWLSVPVTCNL